MGITFDRSARNGEGVHRVLSVMADNGCRAAVSAARGCCVELGRVDAKQECRSHVQADWIFCIIAPKQLATIAGGFIFHTKSGV